MYGNRDGHGGKGKGDGRHHGGHQDGGWRPRRRDDEEERPQNYHHSLEAGHKGSREGEPLKAVAIDALVLLQIMKHCRQHSPQPVTGQLLGLDVEDTLQVTHSFGYMQRSAGDERDQQGQGGTQSQEDGAAFQTETLRKLRDVNVDCNTVGWYQTTHLGQFFSSTVIDTQYLYQTEIARSVLVVYDSLQSTIGKPAFKALQLTPEFMKSYAAANEKGRAAMVGFPSEKMFMEVPVTVSSSAISEAFLVDWALSDPASTTSQVGALDVENVGFLEKNVQLLIGSLQDLADEQNKLMAFERNMNRNKGDGKGKDRFGRSFAPPKQMDTMILSQQIQNYCRALNGYACDAFGKVYLVSNRPTGGPGAARLK